MNKMGTIHYFRDMKTEFSTISDFVPLLTQKQVFDHSMEKLKKAQAKVLAVWAAINLLSGGVLTFITEGQLSYFHAMNASWGIINTGVAAFLYYHHNHVFDHAQTLLQQMDHQRHAEKMILFNIGLDITFMVAGIALYQHALAAGILYTELWKGFGISVMVQGAFLLMQDSIFYRLHVKNRQKVYPFWQKMMENL
jgi:uncharacterized membrane protein